MTESYHMFPAVVTKVEQLTPLIKRFTFKRQDGENFPAFTGGSHIIVKMNDKLSNAYSLMSNAKDLSSYQVCVRKDVEGKGGSVFMHEQCIEGFKLEISSPKNLFELAATGEKHLLIAGGIGITPFLPQMDELAERGVCYELHYAYRSAEHAALWDDLTQSRHAECVINHIDSEGDQLDLNQLIADQPSGTHVYVCGPKPMIDAVIDTCHRYQLRDEYIHWEQFASNAPQQGESFTVILAKTNQRIEVMADQTILQAIESLHIDVECLCREGVCGTCETAILQGEAEHFDQYLDDDEKAAQQSMMICVSRAKGKEITLDL
ncbi:MULTISPECIES: carnitine monooxygenase, reductase subunit CntB [unclassified Acinetobacter]|uniref:carnitine monooxygenase, reductase subunit CntB n=1 Tax=unclassified Acinetobacter TaxID=196816 RepID=UPI002934CDAE|nr:MULTISPECIES: carnitine monooxygenase, reductase subunit CntB [unclassified Acinetobacter]WOE31726.1 carnitine monooxygenase subunit beta [Acinetobacter sp. SAAs470]WOE37193.1 carnitine monooxygenase subunit beta [Acinetobacter sp. SAAs474]